MSDGPGKDAPLPLFGCARSTARLIGGLALLALLAGAVAPGAPSAQTGLMPLVEVRARQEMGTGVFHCAPEPDHNWLRLRTRAGLRLQGERYGGEFILNNEHRHYFTPDKPFAWDEVIIERACWRWQTGPQRWLTVGRQDIVWPGGLLMLEGNPLDGSRSMYHNALRWQTGAVNGAEGDGLDLALIHNPKRDPLVILDDQDRALGAADETALAVRLVRSGWAWSLIYKMERDPDDLLPDLALTTLGGRRMGALGDQTVWHAELALQHQDGRIPAAAAAAADPGAAGWALAGDGALRRPLGRGWSVATGAFYYSGQDDRLRPFRTPWGRWPKWSELYIYSLIGESTPQRSHVAAWENIAAPYLTLTRPVEGGPARQMTASLNATWLLAPAASWQARGLLTRAELKFAFAQRWQGHLLWEMLAPGSFHDGRHGLPPLTEIAHFLRWQLAYSL